MTRGASSMNEKQSQRLPPSVAFVCHVDRETFGIQNRYSGDSPQHTEVDMLHSITFIRSGQFRMHRDRIRAKQIGIRTT